MNAYREQMHQSLFLLDVNIKYPPAQRFSVQGDCLCSCSVFRHSSFSPCLHKIDARKSAYYFSANTP